jgi:hypothetical protein
MRRKLTPKRGFGKDSIAAYGLFAKLATRPDRFSETCQVSKEFAKDDEVIARGIEVVDHRFIPIATGFVKATGWGIGRCAGCLHEHHPASLDPHLLFHPTE